jgi:thioredoxin 1
MKVVNSSEFEALSTDSKVMAYFFASWCGPCRMMSPVVESFSTKQEDLPVVKVDIDESTDLAEKYSVTAVPTTMLIDGDDVLSRVVGVVPENKLTEMVS